MPLYEFSCTNCSNIQDEVFKIADCPNKVKCRKCGEWAVKVIAVGHGGVQCDSINDVKWLSSAIKNLPDDAVKIQSRGEHRRYLKEKNLIACG